MKLYKNFDTEFIYNFFPSKTPSGGLLGKNSLERREALSEFACAYSLALIFLLFISYIFSLVRSLSEGPDLNAFGVDIFFYLQSPLSLNPEFKKFGCQ